MVVSLLVLGGSYSQNGLFWRNVYGMPNLKDFGFSVKGFWVGIEMLIYCHLLYFKNPAVKFAT